MPIDILPWVFKKASCIRQIFDSDGYATVQVPVRPFIPELCVILPQVGTIEFG
jgi:hypothetical protein